MLKIKIFKEKGDDVVLARIAIVEDDVYMREELENLLKSDRNKYEQFFKDFGLQLKYGTYNDYGINKDKLKDLLLFYSSTEKKLVTLKEYVERKKEDQKVIYYACGETVDKIDMLPQVEILKDRGYEILYLTDNVDEFVFQVLMNYEEKTFQNVCGDKLDLDTEGEKDELKMKIARKCSKL